MNLSGTIASLHIRIPERPMAVNARKKGWIRIAKYFGGGVFGRPILAKMCRKWLVFGPLTYPTKKQHVDLDRSLKLWSFVDASLAGLCRLHGERGGQAPAGRQNDRNEECREPDAAG